MQLLIIHARTSIVNTYLIIDIKNISVDKEEFICQDIIVTDCHHGRDSVYVSLKE